MQKIIVRIAVVVLFAGSAWQTMAAATGTVTVDYSKPKQNVSGFGASITWLAGDINHFTTSDQTAILDALYSTTKASAGLSYVRVGSMLCEFNPSPGVYNWNTQLVQDQMSWLNRVKSTYGVNKFLVTTWTPPSWMKDNNSCSGGGTVLPQYYSDLANTMVTWLQNAKAQLGIDMDVNSVQNEPTNSTSYDSANYTAPQFISFVTGYLKPGMQNAGLTTKIMVPEPSVYGGASYFDNNWGFPILNDATMRADVDIMATHGYASTSDLGDPSKAVAQYSKPIWMTEVSTLHGNYDGSITEGLKWGNSIYRALNLGNFNAWFWWWAIDYVNDNGGLIIYDNANWTYKIPKRVYVIGNFSRFIRPGSVVLTSSSTNSNIQATAVRPVSGSVALVLTNQSRQSVTVTVNLSNLASPPSTVTPYRTSSTENQAPLTAIPVSGGSFMITIPASSIVTVVG
jgi:glucuronoarabinoxylan endo-1,4-beta-xylanase